MRVFLSTVCGLAAIVVFGCQSTEPAPAARSILPADALAKVGPVTIGEELFALWPEDQAPRLDAMVNDTLLALESTRRAPHRATVLERATSSRALLEALREEAATRAPPSQQELSREKARNWVRFDRPRAVRSVIVRIPVPEMADDGPYKALAMQLRAAAESAHNVEGLLGAVGSVKTEFEVQGMRMPPVAAGGRVVPMLPQDHEMERVEPSVAAEITALQSPGDLTGVFPSETAYQFALATEIIEPSHSDKERIEEELVQLVLAERVKPQLAELTGAKTKAAAVTFSKKDVPALLRMVGRR